VAPRIHPAKHSEFAPDLNQIELGPTEVRSFVPLRFARLRSGKDPDSFGAFGPKAKRFYRERDSGEVPGVAQVITQSVDRTGGRKKLAKR
jgi:hypothetical protein